MSRISLHRPRRHRAVCHRPATDTRLLPQSLSPHHPTPHQPLQALPKGPTPTPSQRSITVPPPAWKVPGQIMARPYLGLLPSARLTHPAHPLLASSGDALEHSVMSPPWAIVPPWAIAPFSDSPGLDLAGESEQLDNLRLKTNAPFKDSTVVTNRRTPVYEQPVTGPRSHPLGWSSASGGRDCPTARISSLLLHVPSEVRGCRRVVANVEHPLRSDDHASVPA